MGGVVEKNEYTFSYISEGDPETDDLLEISCLDEQSQEVVLKLRKEGNDAIWGKVMAAIEQGEKEECDVVLVTQEAPSKNKSAQNGYDIWQLVIDAKVMKEAAEYFLTGHYPFLETRRFRRSFDDVNHNLRREQTIP